VPELKMARITALLKEFLASKTHLYKVRDIATMVGKLISLEPALGRSVLVGTRLATIAIVASTDVLEASKKRPSL
jgi:hypothetical protein